jgi:hypothetical protein
MRHSVDVMAESLYETAALAVKAFRSAKLLESQPALATELEIKVTTPAVTHTVSVRRLQDWLECSGKTPREQALKHRLRGMLDGQSPVVPG